MDLWETLQEALLLKLEPKWFSTTAFFLCGKTRNSEPLVNIEIRTGSHDELPIRHCLSQFILDEKRQFGHNSNTVPVLFTYDMSWPILKSTISCFNNESVEEYFFRSYRISNGRATSSDLDVKPSKLFLHFCLSHIMHAFSRVMKGLSCTAAVSFPIRKNGQLFGKVITTFLFYYFAIIKQIKLDCTLNV